MKLSQNKLVHHLQVAITCKEHNTEFGMQRKFYNLKQSLLSKPSEFLQIQLVFIVSVSLSTLNTQFTSKREERSK